MTTTKAIHQLARVGCVTLYVHPISGDFVCWSHCNNQLRYFAVTTIALALSC